MSSRACWLLFVEGKVLLAAFAVREVTPAFETRTRRYLKHFDKELGLLANFHGDGQTCDNHHDRYA